MPGVVILELLWAEIAERGVQSAGVVDLIDEAGKILRDVGKGLIDPMGSHSNLDEIENKNTALPESQIEMPSNNGIGDPS